MTHPDPSDRVAHGGFPRLAAIWVPARRAEGAPPRSDAPAPRRAQRTARERLEELCQELSQLEALELAT